MSSQETINIDQEDIKENIKEEVNRAQEQVSSWTEEFVVAGEELVDTIKNLVEESTVRHIEIISKKHNIHFKVPLVFGIGGVAALTFVSFSWLVAVGLIAALVTDCTIRIVREGNVVEKVVEDVAERVETAVS